MKTRKRQPTKVAESNTPITNRGTSALANPFLMMRVAASAHALVLPVAKLENLLADGRFIISPVSIDQVTGGIRHDSSVQLLRDLRFALSWTSGNMEETAAECLCQVAYRLVERLYRLGERGALGDAPKRIRALPINFAPGGSEGASKMKDEVALFEALAVGSEGLITVGPRARAGIAKKGKGGWRSDTEAAIEAAVLNAQWFFAVA